LNIILLCISLVGASLMIWYTYRIEIVFDSIIKKDVAIFHSAEALGTSLVNQKGFVSYYFLDNNLDWIVQLDAYRELFDENLAKVKSLINEPWEKNAITEIEKGYLVYSDTRDKVVELYRAGERKKGFNLHNQARKSFFNILELCEQFKTFHKGKIQEAIVIHQKEAHRMRLLAIMGIMVFLLFTLLVNFIFTRYIMEPIHRLALKASPEKTPAIPAYEVAELKDSVLGLIEESEMTHLELKHSQELQMRSEKMALMGKLAAETAHSIRNPLTSIKMRLFSLNRNVSFSKSQKEDYDVIANEIVQINKIVENFLEFARPPSLVFKIISPSVVVDSAIYLLEQRLQSYNVTIKIIRDRFLPEMLVDPEQFKEVIVNIIINACEAMNKGGLIIIQEEEIYVDSLKNLAVIKITDNGEGIPQHSINHIFDPFFTTKEEGTGLGLNIAFNIISEHDGQLNVSSEEGKGTTFRITLPIKER